MHFATSASHPVADATCDLPMVSGQQVPLLIEASMGLPKFISALIVKLYVRLEVILEYYYVVAHVITVVAETLSCFPHRIIKVQLKLYF